MLSSLCSFLLREFFEVRRHNWPFKTLIKISAEHYNGAITPVYWTLVQHTSTSARVSGVRLRISKFGFVGNRPVFLLRRILRSHHECQDGSSIRNLIVLHQQYPVALGIGDPIFAVGKTRGGLPALGRHDMLIKSKYCHGSNVALVRCLPILKLWDGDKNFIRILSHFLRHWNTEASNFGVLLLASCHDQ